MKKCLNIGLNPNPLYSGLKMQRVGCFPCVMANMQEVKAVAQDDKYCKKVFELREAVNKVRNVKKMRFFVEKEKQNFIALAYTT